MTVIPIRPASTGNQLDRLPALWNTSPDNPAVQARQRQSAERTRMLAENSPDYARELAELYDAIGSYDTPLPEDLT